MPRRRRIVAFLNTEGGESRAGTSATRSSSTTTPSSAWPEGARSFIPPHPRERGRASPPQALTMSVFDGLSIDIVPLDTMLVFRMRDDIHRRLPLPRAWKRLLKACSRDAEAGDRPTLLAQAAGSELR